jgi:hypothetical protein
VVATFLPLLLSVFGGAGGFFAFKIDFRAANTARQMQLFGWSLAAFTFAAVIGVFGGMATKQLWYAQQMAGKAAMPATTDQADFIGKLVMRKRLDGLGASSAEIERFFAYRYDPAEFAKKLAALKAATANVVAINDKANVSTGNLATLAFPDFVGLVDICRRFGALAESTEPFGNGKPIPIELASLLIADLRTFNFESALRARTQDASNPLRQSMMKAVAQLHVAVLGARVDVPVRSNDREVAEADRLLSLGQTLSQRPGPRLFDPIASVTLFGGT